jgi:trehalose 6-phosphate synthase
MISLDLKGRLIIVSNRLPVSIKRKENGQYDFSPSSGGLVAGLSGLAKSGIGFSWYGWPGSEVPEKDIPFVKEELLHKHNAVPVMLDQQTAERYYDGFSSMHHSLVFLLPVSISRLTGSRFHSLASLSSPA